MTIINDHDLWLYADNQKLVAFRTTPAQRSSCMPCPALVYSSTFSSDGLNLATCTSDGFVNVWNIDKNHVDQRFKFSEKETPAACWWSEKFLYVFHVLDGVPTLSKYPMNANSKLLPSQRDVRHFPAEVLHSTTVVDFLEGFLVFKCKKTNSILVLDVKGVADMQMVNLPRVHPNMMITVSPRCSFVFGSGKKMFYIWKRNEAEAPVYEVFFRGYSRDNVGGCCFNSLSNVAVVAHIPFLPHIPLLYFQIIDLDTGKYKTARFQCPLTHPSCKIFCFNKVVICATRNEIYILDMDTGALIEYSFQRYLTKKFLNQLKLSPDETTLAVPMMNGDMEFIRLSIAQNPSLPTLKAEAAIEWDNMC
jgi:WD40 repeat protein